MTTKRRSRVNSVRPAAVEAPAAAPPAPVVEQKAVLDDLPERFRQARDEFYDQKDALQASHGWRVWKGWSSHQRALVGFFAALTLLGLAALLFGG